MHVQMCIGGTMCVCVCVYSVTLTLCVIYRHVWSTLALTRQLCMLLSKTGFKVQCLVPRSLPSGYRCCLTSSTASVTNGV